MDRDEGAGGGVLDQQQGGPSRAREGGMEGFALSSAVALCWRGAGCWVNSVAETTHHLESVVVPAAPRRGGRPFHPLSARWARAP